MDIFRDILLTRADNSLASKNEATRERVERPDPPAQFVVQFAQDVSDLDAPQLRCRNVGGHLMMSSQSRTQALERLDRGGRVSRFAAKYGGFLKK